MAAGAGDRSKVSIGAEDGIGAAGGGAPLEVRVVLHETVCDEKLVLLADLKRENGEEMVIYYRGCPIVVRGGIPPTPLAASKLSPHPLQSGRGRPGTRCSGRDMGTARPLLPCAYSSSLLPLPCPPPHLAPSLTHDHDP